MNAREPTKSNTGLIIAAIVGMVLIPPCLLCVGCLALGGIRSVREPAPNRAPDATPPDEKQVPF
jgi:hypothetical protein